MDKVKEIKEVMGELKEDKKKYYIKDIEIMNEER